MPTLNLRISPPNNPQRYQALAETLTVLTARLLHKRPEVTAVLVQDLPAGQWFVGGAPPRRPTALLEIDITAGTNTAAEKAAFIDAAHGALRQQLAPDAELELASYVIVRELPASDWGYGGQTQRQRHLAREQVIG